MHRRVPDLYMDFYVHAREQGQDEDSAAWYAELQLQQLAESPTLPQFELDPDQMEMFQ